MPRQYLVPGWGIANETGTRQYLVPGWGILDETQPNGSVASMDGTGAFSATGTGAVGAALTATGTGAFAAASPANVATFAIAGTGTFAGVSTGDRATLSAGGSGAFAGVGASFSAPQNVSFLLGPYGVVNETLPRQYLVPGGYFLNENQNNGNSFTAAGTGAFLAAGTGAVASALTSSGAGGLSGRSSSVSSAALSSAGEGEFAPATSFTLVTQSFYQNFDDFFNYLSLTRSTAQAGALTASGSGQFSASSAAIAVAALTATGSGAFSGVSTPPPGGQLDFSQARNSALSPAVT